MNGVREIAPSALEVTAGEVLRYLGYPDGATPGAPAARAVDEAIGAASGSLSPRGLYRILPVETIDRGRMALGGGIAFHGAMGDTLGDCDAAAVFIVTAGEGIERASKEAFRRGDRMRGLVLDAFGSAAVDAVYEALERELRGEACAHGWSITAPYSPGHCGMPLEEQRGIFALLPAARVGVDLTPARIMRPA
ncbi:MAG: hypothetical protein JXP34_19875, partial [Planctomycetes bacterium]|nr:hypothetical protein [Planctomycetota bacterium]